MKKILVTQSSMPSKQDYFDEISSIWDNYWLTNNGPKHLQLENALKNFMEVDNLSLFTNGHLALFLAIKSMRLKGEVITTPFTFASTTNAIVENGLVPVFCDIDPKTYTIDSSKIEELITDKTSAIVAVHVYGNICDVEEIEKIAKLHNLKIIYDAAHVFGVTYNNKSICKYGDISMLSFHATKVFNTIEGGCLIYDDSNLYSRFNSLKNFGIDSEGSINEEGINAKMNEFQAAMGICNLRNIQIEIEKRKNVFDEYIKKLSCVEGIILCSNQKGVKRNFAYFPVIFDKSKYGLNRDEVYDLLIKHNVFPRKYFYPLVSDFTFYRNNFKINNTPIAKNIAENILCLPLYAELTLESVNFICKLLIDKVV